MYRTTLFQLTMVLGLIPLAVVSLFLIGVNLYVQVSQVKQSADQQASLLATSVATTVSTKPFADQQLQAQVNALLGRSASIESVNFYPLSVPVPKPPQSWLVEGRVNQTAPVTSSLEPQATPVGYISVTLNMEEVKNRLLLVAGVQLLAVLLLLIVLAFVFTRLSHGQGRWSVFGQVLSMCKHALTGNFAPILVSKNQSVYAETAQIEEALTNLVAGLKLSQDQLAKVQGQKWVLEREKQASGQSKDIFQAMITHELKSPLNAMGGGLQLIDSENLNDDNREAVRLMWRGYKQLKELLDQVIELNQLQNKQIALSEQVISVQQWLEGMARNFSAQCVSKGLELHVDVNHPDFQVLVDTAKLTDIATYVLDNAVKFTPSGSISLVSRMKSSSWPDILYWQIDFCDTGIGIEEEYVGRIFDPYVQVDSSKVREYEGVGLGLTLAKALTDVMGGRLNVHSRVEEGSVFSLELKVNRAHSNAPRFNLKGSKALLFRAKASDEIVGALNAAGISTDCFQLQNLALSRATEFKYDFIIISSDVSEEDLVAFMRRYRRSETNHRAVVVQISAQPQSLNDLTSVGVDRVTTYSDSQAFLQELSQLKP